MRLEAVCQKCGETFVPDSARDLEHGVREDGGSCGGLGVISRVLSSDLQDRLDDAVREIIGRMVADAFAEDLTTAIGWTIVCTDLTDNQQTHYGFYAPAELRAAFEFAETFRRDVNRGTTSEPGWRVDVHPIFPID